MYSQPVNVNMLIIVVTITVPEVTEPLCPIPLAIVNEVGVVGLPSIPSTATSFSSSNPIFTAIGKNIAVSIINLNEDETSTTFILEKTSFTSKLAPSASNPSGVAAAANVEIDFFIITGCGIFNIAQMLICRIIQIGGIGF